MISLKKVLNIAKYLTGNIFETMTTQHHNAKSTGAFYRHVNSLKREQKRLRIKAIFLNEPVQKKNRFVGHVNRLYNCLSSTAKIVYLKIIDKHENKHFIEALINDAKSIINGFLDQRDSVIVPRLFL